MYSFQKITQVLTAADLHAINRNAVLELIRTAGPISRTEIAGYLKISLPTAMRIVESLFEEGVVAPSNRTAWSGGRRRELVEYNGANHLVIGVDLGGTKIFGAISNLAGEILHENHFEHNQTQSEESYLMLVDSIWDLIHSAEALRKPISGISIGVPGMIDPTTGVVTNAPSLGWNYFPLYARLKEQFSYHLEIENDVNLAALGEFWFGTEPGEENLVLIAIGTGIGAGIIIDGKVYGGAHFMAGEVGYLLPEPACLKKTFPGFGALEQLASGTGIAARARMLLHEEWEEQKLAALTSEDVFQSARSGILWAQKVLDDTIDYLAQAVASIALVVDPDVIVLGGGVARSADLLIDPIISRLNGVIPIQPKITASHLGYRAGILGGVSKVLHISANTSLAQKTM